MGETRNEQVVLVTGAAGAIGRAVCEALAARGHRVRGLDRGEKPAGSACELWRQGDVADRDAVHDAVDGASAIVHLAAATDDAPFIEQLLMPNVAGLFQVMDAAREHGVGRVVLASSLQTVGRLARSGEGPALRETDGAQPRNHYALTKVWAEQMGEMYARVHGMSVIAARIGWLPRNAVDAERLHATAGGLECYLSHDDAGRFFVAAVEAEGVDFAVLFALGLGDGSRRFDRTAGQRVIGYRARDAWPAGLPFAVPAEP